MKPVVIWGRERTSVQVLDIVKHHYQSLAKDATNNDSKVNNLRIANAVYDIITELEKIQGIIQELNLLKYHLERLL